MLKRNKKRENFYNTDHTYLLSATHTHTDLILAGDFNFILAQSDATGHNNYSRALANIVRGLNLTDAWKAHIAKTTYTNYTPKGAYRIDRIHIDNNIKSNKIGIETGRRLYRSFCRSTTHSDRRTSGFTRKRLLENEHIPLERRYLQTRNTDTLEKMANTQKILP